MTQSLLDMCENCWGGRPAACSYKLPQLRVVVESLAVSGVSVFYLDYLRIFV